MKPLHTSSQVTASDSRMVVRVGEISTPDGPVRRIVVEANAEMDTTETRWLRDKLDLAITLAESPDPNKPCPCFFTDPCSCPGWTAIKDCPCYRHTVPNREPAVSEDQPKPREETCGAGVECVCGTEPGSYDGPLPECDVHGQPSAAYKAGYARAQADAEQMQAMEQPTPREWKPCEGMRVCVTAKGNLWFGQEGKAIGPIGDGTWYVALDNGTGTSFSPDALSEVLADSEQVTR